MPMVRGEGDRSGRGRMGPAANRSHRERGQSPPIFPADGESGQTNNEREKAVDNKSGRGTREQAGASGGPVGGVAGTGGGVAGSGRFGRHVPDGGKIPRLKPRYREGERGATNDKTQLPPVSGWGGREGGRQDLGDQLGLVWPGPACPGCDQVGIYNF